MENIEHHCITVEELDSDNESSIQSTNETRNPLMMQLLLSRKSAWKILVKAEPKSQKLGALFAYSEPLKALEKSVARLLLTQKWCQ
ncbi:hypothetical protein CsSME_00038072 [Camellia sinensis var. sinensis]